jgi:hypothetical protein
MGSALEDDQAPECPSAFSEVETFVRLYELIELIKNLLFSHEVHLVSAEAPGGPSQANDGRNSYQGQCPFACWVVLGVEWGSVQQIRDSYASPHARCSWRAAHARPSH